MQNSTTNLLRAIERRLVAISEQQHALALERTRLQEQVTPLRLRVLAPESALFHLRVNGITLRGFAAGRPARRHRRDVVLRAVRRSAAGSPDGPRSPTSDTSIADPSIRPVRLFGR